MESSNAMETLNGVNNFTGGRTDTSGGTSCDRDAGTKSAVTVAAANWLGRDHHRAGGRSDRVERWRRETHGHVDGEWPHQGLGGTTLMALDNSIPTNSAMAVERRVDAGRDLDRDKRGPPLALGNSFQLLSPVR